MRKKNRMKRGLALALSAAMVLGMMPGMGGNLNEVQAATTNEAPDLSQFATVEQLGSFGLDGTKTKAKVKFGASDRTWYIAGLDEGNDNALALLSTSEFQKGTYSDNLDSKYSTSNFVKKGGFFDNYLTPKTYFSETEIGKMKDTTVSTLERDQNDDDVARTVTNKLYIPDAANREAVDTDTIYVGRNNNIKVELSAISDLEMNGKYFWLRSPLNTSSNGVLAAFPENPIKFSIVNYDNVSVVPAFNLNLSSVLFASVAPVATSTSTGDLTPDADSTFTLRYVSDDKNVSAVISGSKDSVAVTGANGKYLMVQNNTGVYALAITADNQNVNASDIPIGGSALTDFSNCKVWIESTNDEERITTATMATQEITSVNITGITAPKTGTALDTTAVCKTEGVETTAPTVTWTPAVDAETGKAAINTVYTASVTLTAAKGYFFTSDVTVKVSSNNVKVVMNDDGSLTVTYSYPKTISNAYYATVDDLMDCYSLSDSSNTVGKIIFGQNGQTGDAAAAQEWKIAGKDTGIAGDNIILFAASPMGAKAYFENDTNDKVYDSAWDCKYPDTVNVTNRKAYPNHYGSSDLRSTLNNYLNNTDYFSESEVSALNPTTMYTADLLLNNNTYYSITDTLYAPNGYYGSEDSYVTVGTNRSDSLNGALRIDKAHWGDKEFWLRTPSKNDRKTALVAYVGFYVSSKIVNTNFSVMPAFDLNLTDVSFASAANAASATGYTAKDTEGMKANTFTLRYIPESNSALAKATATISPDGSNVAITGATDGMYLVAQNEDGVSVVAISSETTSVDINEIDEISSFIGCNVWLESTDTDRITTAKMATQDKARVTITNPSDNNITISDVAGNGTEVQTDITGAMKEVTYTAADGYYFPSDYSVATVEGVSVTRVDADTIKVSGAPTKTTVDITLAAATLKTYTITSDVANKDFGIKNEGYSSVPDMQSITIKNEGNQSVRLSQKGLKNYAVSNFPTEAIAPAGKATFTVQPNAGLSAGTYNETLTVSTDNDTILAIPMTFKVNGAFRVTIDPAKAAITIGTSQKLTANAVGGSGSYTYQWYKGNEKTTLNTDTSLNYITVIPSKTTTYKVVVSDTIEHTQATITITIRKLAQPKNFKVKKSGKTFTISWKKVSGVKGYQVQFKKTGQKSWKNIKKVQKLSKTKWKTSNYIKGRTYQYKVRAYKVVNGKKVYGKWSKVVKIKK